MKFEALLAAICLQLAQVRVQKERSDRTPPSATLVTCECRCICPELLPEGDYLQLIAGPSSGALITCGGQGLLLRHQAPEGRDMALFNIQPGQTLAVFYEDDTVWHERVGF